MKNHATFLHTYILKRKSPKMGKISYYRNVPSLIFLKAISKPFFEYLYVEFITYFFHLSDLYLQMSISFWSLDRQSQCGSCHVCSQLEHYQRQNLLTRVDLVLCFGSGVFFLPHQYSYSSHFTTLKKTLDSVSLVLNFF